MKNIRLTTLTAGLAMLAMTMLASASNIHAQFFGGVYYSGDSTSGTVHCVNENITGAIGYSQPGSFVSGDYVDLSVDWGDGNVDPYPGVAIIPSSGFGYINMIPTSHAYSTPGVYTTIISATDNHGNNASDTIWFTVDVTCGIIYVNALIDDGSGTISGGDIGMSGVPVLLTSTGPSYMASTGTYGQVTIAGIDNTPTSYTLEVDPTWLSTNGLSVIDPASGTHTYTGISSTAQDFTFLLNCGASTYRDLSISAYGWGFRAGLSTGYVTMIVQNTSCAGTSVNADLSLDFDPMMSVFSSSLPGGAVTTGNIAWTGVSFAPGITYVTIYFTVPGATPAGTPLVFSSDVQLSSGSDADPGNNTYNFNSEVRNSWDPNDKNPNLSHNIDVNVVEEIVYTIRFQNMGNDNAINIQIKDTLSSLLNASTFRVLAQSHPGSVGVDNTGHILTFNFPGINLVPQSISDDLSQGFITYAVKENAGLAINSEINNTAYIYFDYNDPVITNTTSNVNVLNTSGVENNANNNLNIYPQPASEFIMIKGMDLSQVTSIQILDMSGKVITTVTGSAIGAPVSLATVSNGMYLLQVTTPQQVLTQKLLVKH